MSNEPIQGELSIPDEQRALSTPAQNAANVSNLLAAAVERGMDADSLEKLLMLQERVHAKQAEAEFTTALLDFQSECPLIGKSRQVDTGKYKYDYAELSHIVLTIRPLLKAHGLSFSFDSSMDGTQVTVRCIISHIGGHSKITTFSAPTDTRAAMNATQQVASAITYARRYALVLALGLTVGEDDDGRRAMPDEAPNPSRNQQAPRAATRQQRQGPPVLLEHVQGLITDWKGLIASEAELDDPSAFASWVQRVCGREFNPRTKQQDSNVMVQWTQDDLAKCRAELKAARGGE